MQTNKTLKLISLGVITYLLYKYRNEIKIGAVGMPRGIRNNNPMNLRISSNDWKGKVQGHDKAFETFVSAEYGIRAGAKVLMTYEKKYGLKTVRGILNRFAPATENDTESYINHVASLIGVGPDTAIDVKSNLEPLVKAIIKHENGMQPYDDKTIQDGIKLALA